MNIMLFVGMDQYTAPIPPYGEIAGVVDGNVIVRTPDDKLFEYPANMARTIVTIYNGYMRSYDAITTFEINAPGETFPDWLIEKLDDDDSNTNYVKVDNLVRYINKIRNATEYEVSMIKYRDADEIKVDISINDKDADSERMREIIGDCMDIMLTLLGEDRSPDAVEDIEQGS